MLTFFRRIRRGFLGSGQTRKYIIYAIGEIALVVIGILIALQINNWNEWRKDLVKEQKILMQLQEEYRSNLQQLDQKISMRNSIIAAGKKVLEYIDRDIFERDSLVTHLIPMIADPTFDPLQNDLISSGNLRLIRNEKLLGFLSNWDTDVASVKDVENNWSRTLIDGFTPFLRKIGYSRDIQNQYMEFVPEFYLSRDVNSTILKIGKSKLSTRKLELREKIELEGMMADAIGMNYYCNIESAILRDRILEIIELIETEMQ